MFRVDPKTVTRWAKAGKFTSIRTLGGHRRYREAEVRALLGGNPAAAVGVTVCAAPPPAKDARGSPQPRAARCWLRFRPTSFAWRLAS